MHRFFCRRGFLPLLCLTVGGLFAGAAPAAESEGTPGSPSTDRVLEQLDGRRIASRVRFLASDFFEGRAVGTHGERLAARYLSDFYYGLSLSQAGDEGSYRQQFDVHQRTLAADGNRFSVTHRAGSGSSRETNYDLDRGFMPFVFSPSARVTAPVVFAGYGIRASEYDWDDYAKLDVEGKIVLLLRHEPLENDPDADFKGLIDTQHAAFVSKIRLAQSLGAAAVLIVTDPINHQPDVRSPGNSLARWASLAERDEYDERPAPKPYQWYPEIFTDVEIPALHISQDAARDLLAGSGQSLEDLQTRLDDSGKSVSIALKGTTATIRTGVEVKPIPAQNVVAKIVGSDPELKEEVVVIGGHFDHVGHGYFGSRTAHWGRIHPGADDNASGTAVIMSVAEAIRQSGIEPRRTIVFIHFTGEERGLWGARWFVDHTSVPIENVVAMINLDMVGRNEPDIISIGGDDNAAGLDALIKKIGSERLQLIINNDASTVIDRSDNWAFALKDIPAVAFTGGGHDEYHAPADISSLIVEDKIENVAKLTALVALEIAEHGLEAVEQEGAE